MKLSITIFHLAVLQMTTVISAPTEDAAAECGDLGVMSIPNRLLAGVNPAEVRKCLEHPLAHSEPSPYPPQPPPTRADLWATVAVDLSIESGPESSVVVARAEVTADLVPRACFFGDQYGCSGGYCWKRCGLQGEWCWLAYNAGYGAWTKCFRAADCVGFAQPEPDCGKGGCDACGCSC